MELKLTNEENQAIKYYKETAYQAINQLLVSDSRSDVALLSDDEEASEINYDKSSVVNYIETIKNVYRAIIKEHFSSPKRKAWSFYRNFSALEIEKLKNEPYIDKFIIADKTENIYEDDAINFGNNQVIVKISGDKDIPYLEIDADSVLISLFTKIKEIEEGPSAEFNEKTIRTYNIKIENQELEKMSEEDKIALYNYIITNSDNINTTLQDTVNLEKENVSNYESIRDLEKQISDLENEMNKKEEENDYSESAREADTSDLNELKDKLEIFKNHSTDIFDNIKANNKTMTEWKRNVTLYLMAECIDIKENLLEEMQEEASAIIEEVKEEIPNAKESKKDKKSKDDSFDNIVEKVTNECKDNIILVQRIKNDINKVINRQQNFAKIAGNLGASYSALNNCFDMKSKAEKLEDLVNNISTKVDTIATSGKARAGTQLIKISEVNNQITILLNYLNNPKTAIAKSKMNRFDEMIVVEENELKRGIAKAILEIRGEAELKKLRDDTQIIQDKSPVVKFFGMFTGQNKLDDFMLEQIEIRSSSIKRTLAKKLRLDYNYSIHEFVAEIRMFIEDNQDDELVEDDVEDLRELEKEIETNFIIIDSKVKDIIDEKERRNLPVSGRLTKRELIEIETYRFLNKYGYDMDEKQEPDEIVYNDTTSDEISRIIDYISTSKVLD